MKNLVITCLIILFIAFNFSQSRCMDPVEYSVTQFGAQRDGVTLNTKSIQTAIDKCYEEGGGTVIIPSGTFLCGGLVMKSNVELQITRGSILLGSTNLDDYELQPLPEYRSLKDQQGGFRALIYAEDAENIAITGSGTICGQGEKYPLGKDDFASRPRGILFISCKNVTVEGLHLRNSAMWMQHYLNCEDVIIRDLRVWNHANRNNDMMDIDGSRRVLISNCIGDTDDDGITFKSTGPSPCEDILVTNCTVSSHCNAIKMGTESTGGFKNITISNCTIKPSQVRDHKIYGKYTGIGGIALELVDGGIMENIAINNIAIKGTTVPLFIRLGNRARPHRKDAPTPPVGKIRNIILSNIVTTDCGNTTSSITGIKDQAVENISLNNIQLNYKGGIKEGEFEFEPPEKEKNYPRPHMFGTLPACGLYIRHVKNIDINGFYITTDDTDVRAPFYADDVDGLTINNSRASIPNYEGVFLSGRHVTNWHIQNPAIWKGNISDINE